MSRPRAPAAAAEAALRGACTSLAFLRGVPEDAGTIAETDTIAEAETGEPSAEGDDIPATQPDGEWLCAWDMVLQKAFRLAASNPQGPREYASEYKADEEKPLDPLIAVFPGPWEWEVPEITMGDALAQGLVTRVEGVKQSSIRARPAAALPEPEPMDERPDIVVRVRRDRAVLVAIFMAGKQVLQVRASLFGEDDEGIEKATEFMEIIADELRSGSLDAKDTTERRATLAAEWGIQLAGRVQAKKRPAAFVAPSPKQPPRQARAPTPTSGAEEQWPSSSTLHDRMLLEDADDSDWGL